MCARKAASYRSHSEKHYLEGANSSVVYMRDLAVSKYLDHEINGDWICPVCKEVGRHLYVPHARAHASYYRA